MPIGYKCLQNRDIARIIVDMLRASIEKSIQPNSNDLLRKFQEKSGDSSTSLLAASDRNFINAHYHEECGDLVQKPVETRRSAAGTMQLSADNEGFYKDRVWPLGIVMYGFDERASDIETVVLQRAMTVVELCSCIAFLIVPRNSPLEPKNLLWFAAEEGEEVPHLGFREGNQTLSLRSMIYGAPGHDGHTLNMLMRILGVPMMSNRYDRDNYVTINWKHVEKTKEHFLERAPPAAWLRNSEDEGAPYDFDSVTHAPANFMCADCSLGQQTVQPLQDHLWQKTLSMGHRSDLSASDAELLSLLYSKQCRARLAGGDT
uniref:Peptidase M12A domain-containing protein n=1 Tax=Heliothis virescens TaxID=7102 RepID=A0A2A4JPR5_HELVI